MTVRHFTFRRKGESNDRAVTVSVDGANGIISAGALAGFAIRRACTALGRAPRDLVLVEDHALPYLVQLEKLKREQDLYIEGGIGWSMIQGQIDAVAQLRARA